MPSTLLCAQLTRDMFAISKFVTFVPNWRCFKLSSEDSGPRFSAVFDFEAVDCGQLVG